MFGFSIPLFTAFQSWLQVLQTSTGPSQQFSAPFKAGNSRQVQTCYKPQNTTQRKLQHFLVYTTTGEMGVLMTLKHRASMQRCSQLARAVIFTFDAAQAPAFSSQPSERMPLSHFN